MVGVCSSSPRNGTSSSPKLGDFGGYSFDNEAASSSTFGEGGHRLRPQLGVYGWRAWEGDLGRRGR